MAEREWSMMGKKDQQPAHGRADFEPFSSRPCRSPTQTNPCTPVVPEGLAGLPGSKDMKDKAFGFSQFKAFSLCSEIIPGPHFYCSVIHPST